MDTETPVRILTKDEIWATDDMEEMTVPISKWGGAVRIRSLSLQQIAAVNKRATTRDKAGVETQDQQMQIAGLLAASIIEPRYELHEALKLMQKSSVAVKLIIDAINQLSGLTAAAVDEADKSDGAGPHDGVLVFPGDGARGNDARADDAADVGP